MNLPASMAAGPEVNGGRIFPPQWQPEFSAAIDDLETALHDANGQGEMNRLSRQIADLRDAELFVLYITLYEKSDAKARAALFREQAAWLKQREKHAAGAVESEGGSLAPLEANVAEAAFTNERIQTLRKRIRAIPGR
jgi:uncharacterized protein YecT (DUF1311 family)